MYDQSASQDPGNETSTENTDEKLWHVGNASGNPTTVRGIIHQCEICDETFVFMCQSQFDIHQELHNGEKPFTCPFCKQQFTRIESFNIHKRIHGGDPPLTSLLESRAASTSSISFNESVLSDYKSNPGIYNCLVCGKCFTLQHRLKRHERIHTKPYKCHLCSKTFSRQYVLNKHIETHFKNPSDQEDRDDKPTTYKCEFCDAMFSFLSDFLIHRDSHVGTKLKLSSNEDSVSNAGELNSGTEQTIGNNTSLMERIELYRCEVCDKVFSTESELNVHRQIHDENLFQCDSDENSSKHEKEGEILQVERRYPCVFCDEVFPSMWQLRDHKRTHLSHKRFTCEICGKKFFRRGDLNIHKRMHTGEKRYSCDICQKRFYKSWNLKIHKMSHNRPENPAYVLPDAPPNSKKELLFQCQYCSKSFAWASALDRHSRTHTGEKPFSCDICQKEFTRSYQVKIHRRSHFGEEKPFNCLTCNRKYSRRENLKLHRRLSHPNEELLDESLRAKRPTEFTCSICLKSFAVRSRLKTHLRIHTGEKPFACNMCDKRYTFLTGLKSHMSAHTGQKPFHCDKCPMRFIDRGGLTRHIKTHTGEKRFSCQLCGKRFSQKVNVIQHEKKCLLTAFRLGE